MGWKKDCKYIAIVTNNKNYHYHKVNYSDYHIINLPEK